MKLGTKIIAGFSALLALAILLGGMAVWKMSTVKQVATALVEEYMPAAAVANQVERDSLQAMLEMRSYGLSEDTNYLAKAETYLAEVLAHIKAARDLAVQTDHKNLGFLKEAADRAEAKASEYKALAAQTVLVTKALDNDRRTMDGFAKTYMAECAAYLATQEDKLNAVLKSTNTVGMDSAEANDRATKIKLVNQIIEFGNEIRVGNFKSQATRDPALFRETLKKFEPVIASLDALKAITKQSVNLEQIEKCRSASQGYQKAMNDYLGNWLKREELGATRTKVADSVLLEAKNTAVASMDSSTKGSQTAASSLTSASFTMIIGLITASIIGIALAILITRSITKVLRRISRTLEDGSNQVVSAASQVSASSQSLAEGSSEQASSLEETSASLEEMASMTKRNSENARQANALAKQAREAADQGVQDMQTMSGAMDAIKASSDDIAKIIKTIDEIAFQTNILALNAAVEAARAGEAGMGFAVVADEVRSLAQRCAQAARETSAKIEGAITKSTQGVEISAKVAGTLNQIVAKARQVDDLVTEVANASREQTEGITQVNVAAGQMDKVTQSNAATAEESAAAAQELNAQAETMKQSVAELLALVNGAKNSNPAYYIAPAVSVKSRPATAPLAAASPAKPTPTAAHVPVKGSNGIHPVNGSSGRRAEVSVAADIKDY